ncbi:hypothetical protein Dimus_018748, partial [Dionaea muscipula]
RLAKEFHRPPSSVARRKPSAAHDEGAREEGNRRPQLDAAARRRAAACMAMRRVYWPHEGEAVVGYAHCSLRTTARQPWCSASLLGSASLPAKCPTGRRSSRRR